MAIRRLPTLGADASWEPRIQPEAWRGAIRFISAWSLFVHDNVGLALEYGPKEGVTGGPVGSGEFARYLYLSIDYGKTWTIVFDVAGWVTNPDNRDIHGRGVA